MALRRLPGEPPRRAQEGPGEPRRAQESPREPKRAQESPGETPLESKVCAGPQREHHFYKRCARRLNESTTFSGRGPLGGRICDTGYQTGYVRCTAPQREARKVPKRQKT